MIASSIASAYPSPTSVEFLKDYRQVVMHRIAVTQETIKATEQKMQRGIDPELTRIFNVGAKTLIDLYA